MQLRLALDWTPNTNHTGFYVALSKGWFAEADLDVRVTHPGEDNYATTPARKLASGEVDLAVAPSESAIGFHTSERRTPLVAIAAILAKDASAVVTLAESGLERPAQLDAHTYASYHARFEDPIVRRMIQRDGGRGEVELLYPDKLGIWNTLLGGQADATWIFKPWEGVQAEQQGVALNYFVLGDYGIPYGYSPVLLAHSDRLAERAEAFRAFLRVARRGYAYAQRHPDEAADLLIATSELSEERTFVRASQQVIGAYYTHEDLPWGVMRPQIWQAFLTWLIEEGILTDRSGRVIADLEPTDLYTDEFLPD